MEEPTVCGVTNDGKLWFLGASEWLDVKALGGNDPGLFVSIGSAASGQSGALHICGITQDGRLWHTIGIQDKWQPFEDLNSRIGGDGGTFQDIGVATVDGELHVCVTAPTVTAGWRILHTIRHVDGTWDSFQDVTDPGFPGSFVSVACAELNKELHVCGVTDDGRLWHTFRSSQNNWLPFEEVQTTFANNPVTFADVSIAAEDGNLQIFAQAGGDVWHTVRFSQPPGWQPVFDSLKAQTGNDPGSFELISCAGLDEELHIGGVTADGKLWYTIHFSNPPPDWLPFMDVTVIVGPPGLFTSVSIVGLIFALSEAVPLAKLIPQVSLTPDSGGPTPPECQSPQREINRVCDTIRGLHTVIGKAEYRQRVKRIQKNHPNCTFDIRSGCLS